MNAIANYEVSRDYLALVKLVRVCSVVCMVDYRAGIRDVARTLWAPGHEELFQVSARGICYIYAYTEAEFVEQCARENLEFIVPRQ